MVLPTVQLPIQYNQQAATDLLGDVRRLRSYFYLCDEAVSLQSINQVFWLIDFFPTPTTDCNNGFEKLKELVGLKRVVRICPSVQSTTAISLRRQGRPRTVSMTNWTSQCLINRTLCHRDWSFFQTICQAAKPKSAEHDRFSPSLNPSDNHSIFINPSSFGCVEVNVGYLWFQF